MAQQPGTVAASNLSRPTKKHRSLIPLSIISATNGDDMWIGDDLLTEILLRLPAKSLTRFKSVCKKWRSLISSDYFCGRHTLRRPKLDPLSLILHARRSYKYFYFDGEKTIIPLAVPDHLSGLTRIMQACNGLLLLKTRSFKENKKPCDRDCCNDPTPENLLMAKYSCLVNPNTCDPPHGLDFSIGYFVYNPITRQSREISLAHKPDYPCVVAVFLAFDPWESPFYKVVCVRASARWDDDDELECSFRFHIEIYDSESRNWKVCMEALTLPPTVSFFDSGVHWNNSIYWHSKGDYFCFDIAKNEINSLQFPPTPDFGQGVKEYHMHRWYLQESNGHLCHFEWSQIYNDRREFGSESVAVWELRRGGDDDLRSDREWLFKSRYVVGDPRWIIRAVMRLVVGSNGDRDGDGDEACTLLTTTRSGRMRAYHFLHNKTYHEDIYDFYPDSVSCFQFAECLALV